jgi:lipopolysaccharide export system protein LptA
MIINAAWAKESKPNFLEEITIISADKLESTKQISILTGNIDIEFQEYRIKSPHARILANADGDFDLASFINGAILESSEIKINADKIEINLSKNLISCYANGTNLIKTEIFDNGSQSSTLYSHYQEYDLMSGSGRGDKDVHYVSKDIDIVSNEVEMQTDSEKKLHYINFQDHATAIGVQERVEAQELVFFPKLNLLKANQQAKFHYLKDDKSTFVFADHMVYEKSEKLLSAFSRRINDIPNLVKVYSNDNFGRSRQILLTLDKDNSVDKAILTGLAYAQNKEKSIVGHEIIFDMKKQSMASSVGRPQTLIMGEKSEPESKKRS